MKRYLLLSLALLLCTAHGWGQMPPQDDPIAQSVFPPELIMRYHSEIGMDDAQSKAIKETIQKAQTRFTELQWEMQPQVEKLAQILRTNPTDEGTALTQLERVLNAEREIKKAQIALLIRIKNLLTEAQQAKLMELRRKP
jgi:hypothetical protein